MPTEITLLLLGESGVGKSTFINAFVNYMTYDTLDEARDHPLYIIPGKINFYHPITYEETTIDYGIHNNNENTFDTSRSATQHPKLYQIIKQNYTINIIDTPGIADTSGIDRDMKNMENLFDFISNYPEITAICVLLKPNNPRLDVLFKYCLYELFSHLNKSAADNILFLYTNTRGTNYAPWATENVLKALLDEFNVLSENVVINYNQDSYFCLDNEAFRYLAASTPPYNMPFNEDMRDDFKDSWDRSVSECNRLLNRIQSLTPHKVMDTLSLNNAKHTILLLTEPLNDIAKNIYNIEKDLHNLNKVNESLIQPISDLEQRLYFKSENVQMTDDTKLKLVCQDRDCVTQFNVDGEIRTHFKSVCHSPCSVENVFNKSGNRELLNCSAFNNLSSTHLEKPTLVNQAVDSTPTRKLVYQDELCCACYHSYMSHIQVTQDTKIVVRSVINETVNKELAEKLHIRDKTRNKLYELSKQVNELNLESLHIREAMKNMAYFIKYQAMLPFNDAVNEYVMHLISKAESSQVKQFNAKQLNKLLDIQNQFNYEKEVILDVIANSNKSASSTDMDEIIAGLYALKWTGNKINTLIAPEVSKLAK